MSIEELIDIALSRLGEREFWALDDLPTDVFRRDKLEDLLRTLGARRYIQVRDCDPDRLLPAMRNYALWYYPDKSDPNTWGAFLRVDDGNDRQPAIRLSGEGRTRLAELQVALPGGGQDDLARLTDPIPVVSVVNVVGHKAGRSDKLADKMKRLNYPVEKRAGKYHCQRADAVAMFPHHRQRIEEI